MSGTTGLHPQARAGRAGRTHESTTEPGDGEPAMPAPGARPAAPIPEVTLAAVLQAAHADDTTRYPGRTRLHWRVLVTGDGARTLLELLDRPWGTRWLHRGSPSQLRPCSRDTTVTLPGAVDECAALLIVEYDVTEPDLDPRRLLAAGQACWRRATGAGLDAVLVSAPGGSRATAPCPVVVVGVSPGRA